MPTAKKLGLALGGGGARGLAHIGVLRVLERAGIEADVIAGTSMGGLIGALYSAGKPLEAVAELVNHGGPKEMFQHLFDLTVSAQGFFRGERIRRAFAGALGPAHTEFRHLDRPLGLVAVDLRSGQEVVLTEGDLVEALRATCAVPGVFLPVDRDGVSLVDGGILNNVPADVARTMGADVVLAVDVLPNFSHNSPGQEPAVRGLRQHRVPATIREQMHVQMIMLSAITSQRLSQAKPDLVLNPVISERVGLFTGYHLAEETIRAGEEAMQNSLPELCDLLGIEGKVQVRETSDDGLELPWGP